MPTRSEATTFPNGLGAHRRASAPTPLYEALAVVVMAAALWALRMRWNPPAVFGAYLALSGISRFLVELLRINEPALLGLTQPQLWALASLVTGVVLIVRAQRFIRPQRPADIGPAADEGAMTARWTG